MRGHTTTSGEDTFCGCHTSEVFGRSFDAHHDDLLTSFVPCFSIVSVEDDLTASSTRRSWKTAGDFVCTSQCLLVEDWVEELIELIGFATLDDCLFVNHTFVKEVDSDLHHSGTSALTITSLQEPEFAFLYGELHVLHVAVVLFELVLERIEFSVDFGHSLFHRRIFSYAFFLADASAFSPALCADFGDLLWSANTSHHVFTLCVNEILTIEEVFTVTSVTAEANASSRSFAHVTEHHGLHVYSRTPFVGNAFHLTIEDSAFVHPAAEHSAHSAPELFFRISGEVVTRVVFNSLLETLYEVLEFFYSEILIEVDATDSLHLFDDSFKWVDVFLVFGLHAEHDITIHLYETAIRVVNEVRVTRLSYKTFCYGVVQTEVEDGVHHTGH